MSSSHRHGAILIQGARLIDPVARRDERTDVAVVNGRIAATASPDAFRIDAAGLIVCPGLRDNHVHLRQPGAEHKETIASGTAAAAAGGFTHVCCMPNTTPPIDTPDLVRFVSDTARREGSCYVHPVACITEGRRGERITDFASLNEAGAVAFSDDGSGVEDDRVMAAAFEQAERLGVILIQHCEFKDLSAGGVMHLGDVSRQLGLPGLDPRSEEAMIERDLDLCRQRPARYHVAHISTAKAVEMVRRAKREGLPVTTEVCPHHLLLTEEDCATADPNTKMHPPLRTAWDVEACRAGLVDGTIDCLVTDHAPHTEEEKARGFREAPPGLVGLETSLGVTARTLIESGLVDWPTLTACMTSRAAAVLGPPIHPIETGARADLTVFDPSEVWTVDRNRFVSRGRNTPFDGWRLTGRARFTIRGTVVFSA